MSTSVQSHRARLAEAGLCRVEVKVHRSDAPLIRQIARTLASGIGAPELRTALAAAMSRKVSFREWMAEASA